MSQYHQDLAREGRKVHNVPELTITHLDANQPEVFVNIVWKEMHLLEPVLLWVLLSWPALVQFIQGEWVQFWPLPLSERGRALKILLSKRLLPGMHCRHLQPDSTVLTNLTTNLASNLTTAFKTHSRNQLETISKPNNKQLQNYLKITNFPDKHLEIDITINLKTRWSEFVDNVG